MVTKIKPSKHQQTKICFDNIPVFRFWFHFHISDVLFKVVALLDAFLFWETMFIDPFCDFRILSMSPLYWGFQAYFLSTLDIFRAILGRFWGSLDPLLTSNLHQMFKYCLNIDECGISVMVLIGLLPHSIAILCCDVLEVHFCIKIYFTLD